MSTLDTRVTPVSDRSAGCLSPIYGIQKPTVCLHLHRIIINSASKLQSRTDDTICEYLTCIHKLTSCQHASSNCENELSVSIRFISNFVSVKGMKCCRKELGCNLTSIVCRVSTRPRTDLAPSAPATSCRQSANTQLRQSVSTFERFFLKKEHMFSNFGYRDAKHLCISHISRSTTLQLYSAESAIEHTLTLSITGWVKLKEPVQ